MLRNVARFFIFYTSNESREIKKNTKDFSYAFIRYEGLKTFFYKDSPQAQHNAMKHASSYPDNKKDIKMKSKLKM